MLSLTWEKSKFKESIKSSSEIDNSKKNWIENLLN